MKLTIGFSPCPNDTFIFDALINKKIETKGIDFEYVLEDVETLNQWAEEDRLDVTKLSYNAFLHVVHNYALLHSGSALGKGVGPLLVARTSLNLSNISDYKVAIPGVNTTANLLFSLAFPDAKNKTEVIFSEIECAVLDGKFDAGLIIHESRFTYEKKGLVKLIDLGDWWENETGAVIPLGAIAIKRNIDKEIAEKVDKLIHESLRYSWKHYPSLASFITDNAQEMEEAVMRKHIELYVNDYTDNLGEDGEKAVYSLFNKAQRAGLISGNLPSSIFY
jgi:1,4-dihydroxy-6-naphthoate synthase